MTKDEFYSSIYDFDDLINFCEQNGCVHIVENVMHEADFDTWVWDEVESLRSHWFWNELRDVISNLEAPTSRYFEPTGSLTYRILTNDDLEEYMDDVIVWGEEYDFWDDDACDDDWEFEEDSNTDDESDVVDVDIPFESSFNLSQFIGVA